MTGSRYNFKASTYGEGFIHEKTRPVISTINSDLWSVEQETADLEKRLKQLRDNKKSLLAAKKKVPVQWKDLQKSVDFVKKPREAFPKYSDEKYEELSAQHRLKISEYTGVTTFL